ncbi:MAG: helix-hairpin-helix domain-containing protein [Sedimenticola sp.]
MKTPDRKKVSQLEELPNIGKAIGRDLRLIGVDHPRELIGKSAFHLYSLLCSKKGKRIDHCVIDVFMSAIHFMEGGEPQLWWAFTEKRKQILNEKEKGIMK